MHVTVWNTTMILNLKDFKFKVLGWVEFCWLCLWMWPRWSDNFKLVSKTNGETVPPQPLIYKQRSPARIPPLPAIYPKLIPVKHWTVFDRWLGDGAGLPFFSPESDGERGTPGWSGPGILRDPGEQQRQKRNETTAAAAVAGKNLC